MARVTVEDCVLQIPNRFNLVMIAARRARALGSGAELTIDRDRDKNPVVSLREIAEMKLDLGSLEESLIKSLQKRIEPEQREEDDVADLIAGEQQSWVTSLDMAAAEMNAEDEEEGDEEALSDDDADMTGSFEDAGADEIKD